MNLLGLALESAAVAAVLATGTALASLVFLSLFSGRSAALRADVAFVAAIAPALVVIVALVAALSPSLLMTVGLPVGDHCPTHEHHPHLCVIHFAGLRPAAAMLGAATLAFIALRAGIVVARTASMRRTLTTLEAMGTAFDHAGSTFSIIELPGAPRICHAVGLVRRRILVSARLRAALSSTAWEAVCAHEDAHLRRRDPLASLIVECALCFVPPVLSGALGTAFRRAVESACDNAAVHRLGGGIEVAEGLLEAARLIGRSAAAGSPLSAPAATEHALEERVRELLEERISPARGSFAFAAGGALFTALVTGAAFGADGVHHGLETLLVFFS